MSGVTDIKTKIENLIINMTLGHALAKREKLYFGDADRQAMKWVQSFFSAADSRKTNDLKRLFAKNAVAEIGEENLSSMLENFLSCHSGRFRYITKKLIGSSGRYDHGQRSVELSGSVDAAATDAYYKMAVKLVPYDDFDPDNVGFWSLNITKTLSSDGKYCGNYEYRTGIFLNKADSD